MMRFSKNNPQSGFALTVILVLSLSATIIGLAMLEGISSTQVDNADRRMTRLANQAAEAGVAYASACLEKSFRQLTWGSANSNAPLTQSTDCNGTVDGSLPQYVLPSSADNNVRTSFSVGEPESLSLSSVRLKAVGTAEVLIKGTTTVSRTYTSVVKKTAVWNDNLSVQRSTSGAFRTCGLLSSSAYCWGENNIGQLGDGTNTSSIVPVAVKRQSYGSTGIGSHPVVALSSAGGFNCLAIDTGEVYCWGNNADGQLGIGSTSPANSNIPLRVSGLPVGGIGGDKVVDLSLTDNSACALTESGRLYCWGFNNSGQVGNNSTTMRTAPVYIGGANPTGGFGGLVNNRVIALSKSGGQHVHMCVVAVDNRAYCWGNNIHGQLGDGSNTNRTVPTAVSTAGVLSGKTVTAVATDGDAFGSAPQPHTCAIAYATATGPSDAKAYCWGGNKYGALGNNGTMCPTTTVTASCYSMVPVAVNTAGVLSGKIIDEIATSHTGSCAIAHSPATPNATAVYCWGRYFTLGDGRNSGHTAVPITTTATQFGTSKVDLLVGGANRMCVRANNKIYCWGSNAYGQIGDGTVILRYVPTEALFLRPRDNQFIF